MEPHGRIRSTVDGAVNALILFNLNLGKGSLGDKLMEKILPSVPEGETVHNENYIILGAAISTLTEAGILVASIMSDHPGTYLAANATVKTIPRVAEWGLRKLRDHYDFSFITRRGY